MGDMAQLVYETDGFAQVFPEHKFEIVRQLQSLDKVVGMTGDGVNDAPALAQAQIGIAVDDATDTARAASDIVLVSPGLSVIITAIQHSREIFLRMKNYAMYSVAMTVRITFTFGLLTVIWNWCFPTVLIVILAILNDGTILTISKDNVKASPTPDSWKLKEVFISSIMFGLWLTASTIVLFAVVYETDKFSGFIDSKNVCVSCLHSECVDVAAKYSSCQVDTGNIKDGLTEEELNEIVECRQNFVDEYQTVYNTKSKAHKHSTFDHLFSHAGDVEVSDLGKGISQKEQYEQYMYQFTVGKNYTPYDTVGGYDVQGSARDSNGVSRKTLQTLAVTNEVGYCDFIWGYSNFNSTWTKGYESIGVGRIHKEAVLRGLIYMQVSISGQALIFVTRTAGINTWFFADMPSKLLLCAFVVAQIAASLIGAFGFNGYPSPRTALMGCGIGYTIIAWIWSIVWQFPLDLIKFATNYVLRKGSSTYNQIAFSRTINAGHPSMAHACVSSRARSVRASRTV